MINISAIRCKAQSDTSNDIPPTGYGRGIFLTGYGDYNLLTRLLDFRNMKFDGNTADKAGQTMYVAMTKVVEWRKEGTAGEYVKGNYSDGISSQNELYGIPVDSVTFDSYSLIQINELQNRLQYYWNVNRDEYYVRSNGSDQQSCNSSNPFISQTDTTRTFRNYPLDNTQLSTILIKASGGFNITGKAVFQLINFSLENSQQQQDTHPGIYGLSDAAQIDLQDCQFHMQNAGLYIRKCLVCTFLGEFNQPGSLIISDCKFENITKFGEINAGAQDTNGGAIYTEMFYANALIKITRTIIQQCEAQNGGGLYSKNIIAGNLELDQSCQFKQCKATSGNGGGIYAEIQSQETSTGFGGGIFICVRDTFRQSTQYFDLKGMKIYNNSASKAGQSFSQGGNAIRILNNGSYPITSTIKGCQFNSISSTDDSYGQGGSAIFIENNIINQQLYQNSLKQGGAIWVKLINGNQMTIYDIQIMNCSSENNGGGIYAETYDNSLLSLSGDIMFDNCTSLGLDGSGGGIYIEMNQPMGNIQITGNITFKNCKCESSGGGLCIIYHGQGFSTLIAGNFTFQGCTVMEYGGGIYINAELASQFEFNINDSLIQECVAKENSTLTYPTGYGGGIFLSGSGDYDQSTKRLDFIGMKIYNYSADKGGQSLYVAMTQLTELCKYDIAGDDLLLEKLYTPTKYRNLQSYRYQHFKQQKPN
ncbi:MAG: hypothetical protein EZS28_016385 [Streblomastix strix]|uniref:Right handed beta helix domain-containing protein n=1 Tax=Streblomastix strix TaxID=222440 RepID=A0A5J4VZT9_9EUKA|nr:MAG: hypothetical protein EZS28_016385 [Streblomastix strix]